MWVLAKLYDMDAFLCAYNLYYIVTYYFLALYQLYHRDSYFSFTTYVNNTYGLL